MFRLLTPITYWVLIVMWSFILLFYLKRLRSKIIKRQLLFILLLILAIDAFRTLFESVYFGAWYTSLAGILPEAVYTFLVRPEMVFIPKIINVVAATVIIGILLYRWLPQEEQEKDQLEKLIQERTAELTQSNEQLKNEIVERKHAEKAVKARESFLDRVIDQSPFAIWISDTEGTLQRANPALKKFLNLTDEQLVGKYNVLEDKIAERKGLQPLFRTVFEEGKTITFSLEWDGNDMPNMDLKGSNSVSIEATMFPVHNPEGELINVVLISIEITGRKRAEEELGKHREHLEKLVEKRTEELKEKTDKTEESRKALTYLVEDVNNAREDLEKANRDIGAVNRELQDFAYIVSHDLKAPLRAVSQLAYWISEDYAEVLDEDGKENLNLLSGRVKRMDALINGILQYSRVGRAKEKQDKIDLDKTLPSIIETLAPPENIRITLKDELPEIVGNKTHMEQVFQNLIGNAIKFMNKPEGLITIGCRGEGSHWQFSIEDNGPGINPKYHDRIFKIFQTLSARDERESTGIGLTLVKKIIELYNGEVWVESDVGKGSSFVFTLPKKKA